RERPGSDQRRSRPQARDCPATRIAAPYLPIGSPRRTRSRQAVRMAGWAGAGTVRERRVGANRRTRFTIGLLAALNVMVVVFTVDPVRLRMTVPNAGATAVGIHKIRHVVVIMQENRSFDTYFGTYPGADGIPMKNGKPTVCSWNPQEKTCVAPYVDHADDVIAGPHGVAACTTDT